MIDEPRDEVSKIAGEVLMELSGELELLGATLCSNVAIVRDHIGSLQQIDAIAQKQRSLAAILGAPCPISAINDLGLEELRTRLTRTLGPLLSDDVRSNRTRRPPSA